MGKCGRIKRREGQRDGGRGVYGGSYGVEVIAFSG